MIRFIKAVPCALFLLAACSGTQERNADERVESQTLASGSESKSSTALNICDSLTSERAEKLNRYAQGSYKNGVITRAESETLQKLTAHLLACATEHVTFAGIAVASENLQKVKQQLNAGIATRQMLLQAEQKLIDATFCEKTLGNIREIETILQKESDVGFRSIVDFVPALKKRLVLLNVCSH